MMGLEDDLLLFQGCILRFHVNLPGCMLICTGRRYIPYTRNMPSIYTILPPFFKPILENPVPNQQVESVGI